MTMTAAIASSRVQGLGVSGGDGECPIDMIRLPT
jgi:hypothetical protein